MDDELLNDLLEAVNQQVSAPRTDYVARTIERLVGLGFSNDEAREQVAWCLGEIMDTMMRSKREFDERAYREALGKLPDEE